MRRLLLCAMLLSMFAAQAKAQGFDKNYEAYIGDINGDGYSDIYIRQKPKLVIIAGDINIPIVLPPEIDAFAVLGSSPGTFSIDTNPGNPGLSTLQPASFELALGDFNLDGFVDLHLKGLALDIPGSFDQIVYADRTTGSVSTDIKAVDNEFQSFFTEVNAWMQDTFYYENTALQNGWYVVIDYGIVETWWNAAYLGFWGFTLNSNGQTLVEITDDPFDSTDPPNGCTWVQCRFQNGQWQLFVTVRDLEIIFDYSNFNQDAVQYRGIMVPAMDQGEIVAGTTAAQTIETILEGVLGTSVMGDVLTNPGTSLDIEDNVPAGSLDEYRLGALVGSTGYCPAPLEAGDLGLTLSGPACVAGIVLEPTPASEIACICYYTYRIYKFAKAVFDVTDAANDDEFDPGGDCQKLYQELEKQKAMINGAFISGNIGLAKYNEWIARHNLSVADFEAYCYPAPELYLQ